MSELIVGRIRGYRLFYKHTETQTFYNPYSMRATHQKVTIEASPEKPAYLPYGFRDSGTAYRELNFDYHATCHKSSISHAMNAVGDSNYDPYHAAPQMGCTCGFHAYYNPLDMFHAVWRDHNAQNVYGVGPERFLQRIRNLCFGVVECSGHTILHQSGFRSKRMRLVTEPIMFNASPADWNSGTRELAAKYPAMDNKQFDTRGPAAMDYMSMYDFLVLHDGTVLSSNSWSQFQYKRHSDADAYRGSGQLVRNALTKLSHSARQIIRDNTMMARDRLWEEMKYNTMRSSNFSLAKFIETRRAYERYMMEQDEKYPIKNGEIF